MYKILVVDDEPVVRNGIIESISFHNLGIDRIGEADGGIAALEMMEKTPVDLIITDIKMPEMDGITFIQEIRKKSKDIPIIVISGYSDFTYLQSAIRYGVNDYILKPIRKLELNSILETAIEKIAKSSTSFNQEVLLKETILYRMVSGTIGRQEAKEKLEQFGIRFGRGKYRVSILRVNEEHTWMESSQIAAGVEQELFKENQGAAFLHPNGEILCIFCRITGDNVQDKMFQNLRIILRETYGIECVFSAGEIVDEIEELPYSYSTAGKWSMFSELCGKEYSKLISDVLLHIQKHYAENLTLKNLADQFFVNPSYLGYLFKKETGTLFNDYVNQCRISFVSDLLENSTLKVYEIMDRVGIQDSHYFTRMFKKYKGMTPTEYRNSRGSVL